MYSLTCTDAHQYANPGEVYVLDILPTNAGLAAISSDQTLSLFNATELKRGPVRQFTTSHGNITALRASEPMSPVVLTAGENGSVSVWDLRDPATSSSSAAVLTQPRDARELSQPKVQYNEVHSDDITELNFSPADPNLLLSGSTDGLVNICDIRIADEDEVIVQTFNHGASIHRAGFLNQTEVFALSNDEKLALYDMAEQQEKGSATLDFSDMRSVIQCQYVASVHPKGPSAAVIGAGAQDEHRFQLIHLSKTPGWGLDSDNVVNLPGAHGEEVVRSFCVFDDEQVVYTGGEDGQIKAWRPTS